MSFYVYLIEIILLNELNFGVGVGSWYWLFFFCKFLFCCSFVDFFYCNWFINNILFNKILNNSVLRELG